MRDSLKSLAKTGVFLFSPRPSIRSQCAKPCDVSNLTTGEPCVSDFCFILNTESDHLAPESYMLMSVSVIGTQHDNEINFSFHLFIYEMPGLISLRKYRIFYRAPDIEFRIIPRISKLTFGIVISVLLIMKNRLIA